MNACIIHSCDEDIQSWSNVSPWNTLHVCQYMVSLSTDPLTPTLPTPAGKIVMLMHPKWIHYSNIALCVGVCGWVGVGGCVGELEN